MCLYSPYANFRFLNEISYKIKNSNIKNNITINKLYFFMSIYDVVNMKTKIITNAR